MANPIIYQRTITSGDASGSVEQGTRLQNGCFARQFGTSAWEYIRLGLRWRVFDVNNTGVNTLTGIPRLIFGFCSGTDNIPGDATLDNMIAMSTHDSTVVISTNDYWNFYANTSNNLNLVTGSYGMTLGDINNDIGFTTYDLGQCFIPSYTSSCDMMFFDVIKATGTDEVFSFKVFGRTSATSNANEYISDVDFLTELQSLTPTRAGYSYASWAYPTYPISSSVLTYPLNSVFVYWERTDPAIEIVDLYVMRLG